MSNNRIRNEIEGLGYKLERFHGLFYQLWRVSSFTSVPDSTFKKMGIRPTCGVGINPTTKEPEFMFSETFWDSMDEYNKMFIICHEMLHLALRHIQRTKALGIKPEETDKRMLANIAQDVCINEMLIKSYGFDRNKIKNWKELCWMDTVFPNRPDVQPNREFEYYYDLLKLAKEQCKQQTVDAHGMEAKPGEGDSNGQGDGKLSKQDIDDLQAAVDKAIENLTQEELENIVKQSATSKEAGKTTMGKILEVKKKIVRAGRWEKIYRKWITYGEMESDDWTRKNRRMSLLEGSSFILPAEHEKEELKCRAPIHIFLDTSGSCAEFAQDFFDALQSIPKAKFDVTPFCFDTRVYEMKGNKLQGFGGTSFSCIQKHIESLKVHPHSIWVITDGYGDRISPKYPEKWHWFLSEQHSLEYIPKESPKFYLESLTKIG